LSEGNISIDFSRVTNRDKNNGTKFEVAGRLYFETHAYGPGYNSFTTNGFLDKEGYVEPQMSPSAIALAKNYWIFIVAGLALLMLFTCYCCFCRTPKKKPSKVPSLSSTKVDQNLIDPI